MRLKYNKDGLIPVIIQEHKTGKILMMAYMNKLSYTKTFKTKKTHFFSRSRKKLWMKGEKSGNFQIVKEIYLDCDNDTLLIKVEQVGGASCHTGYDTCFFREIKKQGQTFKFHLRGKKIFDPKKVYV